jgi:CBS domain containing-hemolysin-like protein
LDDLLPLRSLLLFIFLILSAFFAACEAAFFSLNPLQLATLKDKKGRSGRLVNKMLEKPRELLITIYIGNELVNIAISALVTSIAIRFFDDMGIGIAIGAGTFIILVFGEIAPKSLSWRYAEFFAPLAAYPLKVFSLFVQPVQSRFTKLAEKFLQFTGVKTFSDESSVITDDEFRAMVEIGEGEGIIDADEREMIHNVIEFGETTVAEIMTPKIDMFALNADDKMEDILPKIIENFYSRVPVFDRGGETIIGILFTKDLNKFRHLPKEKFNLKSVVRSPVFVPKSKKIKELLQDFKKMKRHMAIVLNEYGSVDGLVSLEDILEELVGEIDSEMRKDEKPIVQINENSFDILSTYPISDFNEYFNAYLDDEQSHSIGGFVFDLFGRVPRSGEVVTHENFKFQIEKMKGARIVKINLTVFKADNNTEESEKQEEAV